MRNLLLIIFTSILFIFTPGVHAWDEPLSFSPTGNNVSLTPTITINNIEPVDTCWANISRSGFGNVYSNYYENNTTNSITINWDQNYLIPGSDEAINGSLLSDTDYIFNYDCRAISDPDLHYEVWGSLSTIATSVFTMNSGAVNATSDLLASLVAVVFTIIPIAIAIVGGLVVTLFGLRWLIRYVRKFI